MPAASKLHRRQQLSAAGFRAFQRISEDWNLSIDERITLLGLRNRDAYYRAELLAPSFTDRVMERLSHVLGIYKSLQLLLPHPSSADAWMRKPNNEPLFNGASALDFILGGGDGALLVVRRYLDAQRGGWA